MKTKLSRAVCLITLLFLPILISAQNYEGVWTPTESGAFGNMKIRKTDNGYYVQIKFHGKILSAEVNPVNGIMGWDVLENENYGSWWIGTWRQSNEDGHILVGHDDGYSYGTNGRATKIFDNSYKSRERCAKTEKEFIGIMIRPEGDDLIVSWRLFSNYIANGRIVFTQSFNWIPMTYTNW